VIAREHTTERAQRNGRSLRAGWSKTRLHAGPGPILDVGSGAYPHPLATVICDRHLQDHTHRHGAAPVVDDRLVVADALALPFRDGAFAFVIASHIAEHIDDPVGFCHELQRVARAGYIETPSVLAETMLPEPFHRWRVGRRGRRLVFTPTSPPPRWLRPVSDLLYRVFYVGQHDRGRTVLSLPAGRAGRIVARTRWLVAGTLNRSHLLPTRISFDESTPFTAEVRATH
jgi:hypothetical protein